MSDERNPFGQFENNNMGSTFEQARAGVNNNDTELSAQSKVHESRMGSIAKNQEQMANPFYAAASAAVDAQNKALRPYSFVTWIALMAIALAWWYTPVPYFNRGIQDTDTPGMPKMDPAFIAQGRVYSTEKMAYLFKEGAPLASAFNACAARPCDRPDLRAIDSLRSWAADTATPWDTQVCDYFTAAANGYTPGTRLTHLGIEATYRLDRSKGMCIQTNHGTMKGRADLLNYIRHGLALLLAIGTIWWFKRKVKAIEKKYSLVRRT